MKSKRPRGTAAQVAAAGYFPYVLRFGAVFVLAPATVAGRHIDAAAALRRVLHHGQPIGATYPSLAAAIAARGTEPPLPVRGAGK